MSQARRAVLFLLVVAGLVAASVVAIVARPTVLGLDLQGGVEVVLQGKPTAESQVTPEAIERSVEIIRNRVDGFGVSEPEIQTQGSDQIVVALPGADDPQVVEDLIAPAQLAFYDYEGNLVGTNTELYPLVKRAQRTTPEPPIRAGSGQCYLFSDDAARRLVAGPEVDRATLLTEFDGRAPADTIVECVPPGLVIFRQLEQLDPTRENSPSRTVYTLMQDKPGLTGKDVTEAAQTFDQGANNDPIVTMQFTDEGSRAFADVTRGLARRGALRGELQSFAIVLDGEIISTPTVDYRQYPTGIDGRNGAQIQGNFTIDSARALAEQLNSGAIPISLEVISEKQVSATLGEESLRQALIAGLVGLALVLLFLVAYYRLLGLVAILGLAVYSVFFFAFVVLVPITLTLPGIAGIILTIGVAADANVIIFERVREEVRAGRSTRTALLAGYQKGISSIIDANVVTLATAGIIFLFATSGPKGFAFTLFVGVLLSLFTAVLVTRAVIESTADTRVFKNDRLTGLRMREPRWKFDFVGKWRLWLALSFVPLAAGAAVIGINGLNLGLDFESGTRITLAFQEQVTETELRGVLGESGFPGAKVQATTDPGTGQRGFQIQTESLQPAQQNELRRDLDRAFEITPQSYQSVTVGPTFGRQVIEGAIYAILLSFIVLIVYLSVRFEYKLALPALLSVVHDTWLALSVYAIFDFEVTGATVAALLTILGYSLYDVVIVFDRIRENVPIMRNFTYREVVNRSVHQVLTRSLITGLTTLLPVLALFLFGGETLRDFSFALLIGILTGGVSSIVIAAPLAALWKEREPESRKRAAKARKQAGRVESDADVVDLAVLERAEAALDAEIDTEPTGFDGQPGDVPAEPEPEPERPRRGRRQATVAEVEPEPEAGVAPPARAAAGAPSDPMGDDAPAAPDAPPVPDGDRPRRERRNRQIQQRRRRRQP